jgi:hypothetical protein
VAEDPEGLRTVSGTWYSIPEPTWDRLREVADARDALSAKASNTRRWAADFNFVGLVGEALLAYLSDVPVNVAPTLGDGGFDLPGLDVKTSTHEEPWLRLPPDEPLRAEVYALAQLDPRRRQVRLVGYATRAMVQTAEVYDLGHGLARRLTEADLLSAEALIPRLFVDYIDPQGYRPTFTRPRVTRTGRNPADWLCSDCHEKVALRDGLCGACWLTVWKVEQEAPL